MYSDKSLVPKEAVRLMALGSLMEGPRSYGDLAREIRFLTTRVMGPSLDLLGSSLELLRIEGLAAVQSGAEHLAEDQRPLTITETGRERFESLMAATVTPPLNDISRLVLILKLRFLPLLSAESQIDQLELLEETYVTEEARFRELMKDAGSGPLPEWLAIDAEQAAARLSWIQTRLAALENEPSDDDVGVSASDQHH